MQNQENKNPETTTINPDEIEANLSIVREQTKELDAAIKELEDRLRLVRGTRDVTEEAKAARPVGRPRKPTTQVVHALHGASMNVAQVAKATGLSVGKAAEAVKAMRTEKKVANMGSEDFPLWTMRIGDNTSAPELNVEVKRLITERPMTMQELLDITGARLSRISGALIALQRTENQLLNLGTQRRAKWFLVRDGATVSRVAAKV